MRSFSMFFEVSNSDLKYGYWVLAKFNIICENNEQQVHGPDEYIGPYGLYDRCFAKHWWRVGGLLQSFVWVFFWFTLVLELLFGKVGYWTLMLLMVYSFSSAMGLYTLYIIITLWHLSRTELFAYDF